MVSTRTLISKSSSPFISPLVTVPKAPVTIGTNLIFMFHTFFSSLERSGGVLVGVMVKALDCRIIISEFEHQSCYYVHFRANTLGKGMSTLILAAMG